VAVPHHLAKKKQKQMLISMPGIAATHFDMPGFPAV
jgi:hypothetical protein